MSGIDFKGIADDLLLSAKTILPEWLPGGKLIGEEFVCGNLRGEPGRSLSINVKSGVWKDFSSGEGGADLISLYAAIQGVGQGEAAKQCASRYFSGLSSSRPTRSPPKPEPHVATMECKPNFTTPPKGNRPIFRTQNGDPTHIHEYKNQAGETLFFIARYDTPSGKTFLPFSYDGTKWITKSHPKPRPLYGLELLARRPTAPVIVVEGEKAADYLRRITSLYVVVTWPGGANAVESADFTPLYGRKLLLWPDADEPGKRAMAHIAKLLNDHATEIKILDVSGMPDHFDAADSGFDWRDFSEWAKPRARLFTKVHVEQLHPRVIQSPEDQMRELIEDHPIEGEVMPPADNNATRPDPLALRFFDTWAKIGLELNRNGLPVLSLDNATRAIARWEATRNLCWYDEFEMKVLTTWVPDGPRTKVREWSSHDTLELTVFMQRELGLARFSDDLFQKAMAYHAYKHRRNECKEWMMSLTWDGTPRVDTFFHMYFGAKDEPEIHAASKNFWISMAARVHEPGCKADNMVVLEGRQGTYKSTALRVIGGKWMCEATESVMSKDFFMVLHGNLIVEVAEMDSFSRAEDSRIKHVLSNPDDRFRAPYAAKVENHPRQGIMVGTTNERVYLKDHTGARRFWPVPVGRIDIEAIKRDRDQLFAEAVHKYKMKETWHEMPDSIKRSQEDRHQVDPWEDIVIDYLERHPCQDISTHEIYCDALKGNIDKLSRAEGNRIGKIMHRIKWEPKPIRRMGRLQKRWVAPETPPSESFN